MATNITGVQGTGQGSSAANRTDRANHLATQIGEMSPQQARDILSTLNGKIGNRWGYLRLDGSGENQEVAFTTRWNTNPFRSARGEVTGGALKALFEKAGYDTRTLTAYLSNRGNAGVELARVMEFIAAQVPAQRLPGPQVENEAVDLGALDARLTQQCNSTMLLRVDFSVGKLREASEAIRNQPDSERHKYYAGQNPAFKRADQLLYLIGDSLAGDWDDLHFEIFKNLETLVNTSRTDPEFQGVAQRFDQTKAVFANYLRVHPLKTEIDALAGRLQQSENSYPLQDAKQFLSLLSQSANDDVRPYLKHTLLAVWADVATHAIDIVLQQPQSDESTTAAINLKTRLINYFPENVLDIAQNRVADGLPEIQKADVEWMRLALDKLHTPNEEDVVEVLFSNFAEGVNLFLYAASELEKKEPQSTEFWDSARSIRAKHEENPDISAAITALRDIHYDPDFQAYVFPLENQKVLTCSAEGFEAWVTGKNPSKDDIVVFNLDQGAAKISQNELESNRMEGLPNVSIFTKGLTTLDSKVARDVVDHLLVHESPQSTQARFRNALSGEKGELSVSQLNEEIVPVFTRIWGQEVVASDPGAWDNVQLSQEHLSTLKELMPSELSQSEKGFSHFALNLSAIFTKLGSASVWGSESTSVAELRLYGYLLLKEARLSSPDLLQDKDWTELIQKYKDRGECAQILSFRQMELANAASPAAHRLVVPLAMRR
jgi:hypothetical protein